MNGYRIVIFRVTNLPYSPENSLFTLILCIMSDQYITVLLNRLFEGTISDQEKEELARWVSVPGKEEQLQSLLERSWHSFEPGETLPAAKADNLLQSVLLKLKDTEKQPAKLVSGLWRRIAIAASVFVLIGVGGYFLFFNRPVKQQDAVTTALPKDITAPKGNKAVIALANGQTVALDSVTSGILASQDNLNVIKTSDGSIVYKGTSSAIKYNTLFNPRGSKVIDLTLSDGTKVWLNAGSSLTYFTGNGGIDRQVSLTGEAYFEVAKDKTRPFIVKKSDAAITVLGTHFNVNAFDDETNMKVTLLEGSVKITMGTATALLKPGKQAVLSLSTLRQTQDHRQDIKIESDIDLTEVMAWKNGEFIFDNNADIRTIMRQIGRWYDVEVEYSGTVNSHFWGSISRDVNLLEVLEMLEKTGGAKFKLEGKKVIVMP